MRTLADLLEERLAASRAVQSAASDDEPRASDDGAQQQVA
jgi:hypothetical protein